MTFCGIVETVLAVTKERTTITRPVVFNKAHQEKDAGKVSACVNSNADAFIFLLFFLHFTAVGILSGDLHWSCFHISYVSIMQCKVRTVSTEKDGLKNIHANSTDRGCGKGLYQISVLLFLKSIRANKIQAESNTFWYSDTGFLSIGKKLMQGRNTFLHLQGWGYMHRYLIKKVPYWYWSTNFFIC